MAVLKITSNSDVLTGPYPMPRPEFTRLTKDLEDGDDVLHESAWKRILADLLIKMGLQESDLSDTAQFVVPATYYVIHLMYLRAKREMDQANFYLTQYERSIGAIEPDTTLGNRSPVGSRGVLVSRG